MEANSVSTVEPRRPLGRRSQEATKRAGGRTPRVSIGMPVFNNAATLAAAVNSILAQTEQDFEIILSDDGSTDGSWALCQSLAKDEPRIRCYRQPVNLFYENFRFTLDQARAPYFAWLAGDDIRMPEFIARCAQVLDERPDVVACVPKCRFMVDGRPDEVTRGTAPLTGAWEENAVRYLRTVYCNSRQYGVFRTEALRRSAPDRVMFAYDFAYAAGSLRFGTHHELDEVLMVRDRTQPGSYLAQVRRCHRAAVLRLFPVLAVSLFMLRKRFIPPTPRVLAALLVLNMKMHLWYMRASHPRAARLLAPLYAALQTLRRRVDPL